nr:hypothetical protein [Lachnospiraceae bacterium]
MKIKTVFYVVLAMMLVVFLCACGNGTASPTAKTPETTAAPETTAKKNSGRSMDELLDTVLADKITKKAKTEEKDGGFVFEAGMEDEGALSGKADADRFLTSVTLEMPVSEHQIEFMKSLTITQFVSFGYSMSSLTLAQLEAVSYLISVSEAASFCAGVDTSDNGAYLDIIETLLSAREKEVIINNWSYRFVINSGAKNASVVMTFIGE